MKHMMQNILVIGVGMVLSTILGFALDDAMSPHLIYKVKNLPAFADIQDYSPNLFAPMVRLEKLDGQFFCSGTVISDDYVLTAAHCVTHGGMFPGLNRADMNVVSIKNADGVIRTQRSKPAAANIRADYALIKGDFRDFTKLKIITSPATPFFLSKYMATCGFPWGSGSICYPILSQLRINYHQWAADGLLYPGMSGGPTVDSQLKVVFAINAAVGDGFIIVAPLIGLFETLGVEVVKAGP